MQRSVRHLASGLRNTRLHPLRIVQRVKTSPRLRARTANPRLQRVTSHINPHAERISLARPRIGLVRTLAVVAVGGFVGDSLSQNLPDMAAAPSPVQGTMEWIAAHADHSWVNELNADPESSKHKPNRSSRQVRSGHYVLVEPTALPKPKLVAFSAEMCKELGLNPDQASTDVFVRFLSGDTDALPAFKKAGSWATPYALAIYGQEMYRNCPFGNGNGYGDGRAISIAEVQLPDANAMDDNAAGTHWELQLKGGGRTPFCRGGDGRAVLRSSVREFLVSEAMHHLGVSTTRALSLIVSGSEVSERPWYSGEPTEDDTQLPDLDDPRIAHLPMHIRKQLIEQLADQQRNPDVMIREQCAITCRTAPSFLRVGHVDLFARRARKGDAAAKTELAMIVEHAIRREYRHINDEHAGPEEKRDEAAGVGSKADRLVNWKTLQPRALQMLEEASNRISELTANWMRVGYCQGNFNSDNCLVAGRTMDYGPFGFMERFKPLWNMWVGGGEHFGFLNQDNAGGKNFETLVNAVKPLLDADGELKADEIIRRHYEKQSNAVNDMWRRKLGLARWSLEGKHLLARLLQLMESNQADYTIVWRSLAMLAPDAVRGAAAARKSAAAADTVTVHPSESPALDAVAARAAVQANDGDLFAAIRQTACYSRLTQADEEEWRSWLREWATQLQEEKQDGAVVQQTMLAASPMYVPREWMLVAAYRDAQQGKFEKVEELQRVFLRPYDEQDEATRSKFYRKAPLAIYKGSGLGGQAYMT